jgi:hypothetical protein
VLQNLLRMTLPPSELESCERTSTQTFRRRLPRRAKPGFAAWSEPGVLVEIAEFFGRGGLIPWNQGQALACN